MLIWTTIWFDKNKQNHLNYVSDLYEEIQSLRLINNLSSMTGTSFSIMVISFETTKILL